MYTVTNVLADGTAYDITPLVSSIRWGGDIRQTARRLEVSLVLSRDANLPRYTAPPGSLLVLKNDSAELLRGVVFTNKRSTDGEQTLIAYDHLIYLLKSKGTYIFRNLTADAVIRKLCGYFAIPVGSIAATGVTLPKLILRNESIYDMCIVALTETTKRTGKKYVMKMIQGKLHVIEKAKQTVRWVIAEGSNLIGADYSESIEEMRNRVVVLGDKDQVLATVEDAGLIKLYGILQELKQEGNIKAAEAQTIAKNLLKELGRVGREAAITCLGLDDVEAGTAIEVKESLTGLTGTFYVDTDEHEVKNSQHTMTLKLNWTDEVATKEAAAE